MDIHKPKPWHGVREFLKEFGVIVLGVLVALGAEQSVEWLHRQAEVREARAALRAEIADDMMWAQLNQRRQVCNDRYLQRYVIWAEGGPAPAPAPLGAGRLIELFSTSWDVVKAGPVASMPLKEKLAFARFYGQVADYNTMAERERTAIIRLGEHSGLKRLSAEQADSLLKATTALRGIESTLVLMAGGVRSRGVLAGGATSPATPEIVAQIEAFCHVAGVD